MNDCHYYFDNTMSLPFKHTLLISGMNFCPYKGQYKLPFNDGYFEIKNVNGKGVVNMAPKSTTCTY